MYWYWTPHISFIWSESNDFKHFFLALVLTGGDCWFIVAFKINLPVNVVMSSSLETFKTAQKPWLPLLSVGDSPVSSGRLDVRSPEVLFCFHGSVQEWEPTWKELLHPIGPAYLGRWGIKYCLLIQRAVVFFAHPAAYWYSSEEKKNNNKKKALRTNF